MITFKEYRLILEAKKGVSYSDEHAHVNIWNHMVNKGIAHDKDAMMKELHSAKTDKKHSLHFDNAKDEGFVGGKKTKDAHESYHAELETAVHTIHSLANHKDFKDAIKNKHEAIVVGGARGPVSDTWKKHGATKGAVSKADVAIKNPKDKTYEGLKLLSMKKGGGSQLMSAGPEENKAVHDHATKEMLASHPKYAKLSKTKKDAIHAKVMEHMNKIETHVNAMKTSSRDDMQKHKNAAQKLMDAVHDEHPELNHYVRKEATTGQGKFGVGSAHAASYLVKSGTKSSSASVKHVDEQDYSGPRPRIALPKGEGRSGNIKLDER